MCRSQPGHGWRGELDFRLAPAPEFTLPESRSFIMVCLNGSSHVTLNVLWPQQPVANTPSILPKGIAPHCEKPQQLALRTMTACTPASPTPSPMGSYPAPGIAPLHGHTAIRACKNRLHLSYSNPGLQEEAALVYPSLNQEVPAPSSLQSCPAFKTCAYLTDIPRSFSS